MDHLDYLTTWTTLKTLPAWATITTLIKWPMTLTVQKIYQEENSHCLLCLVAKVLQVCLTFSLFGVQLAQISNLQIDCNTPRCSCLKQYRLELRKFQVTLSSEPRFGSLEVATAAPITPISLIAHRGVFFTHLPSVLSL